MAFRIHDSVVRGEIDNRVKGFVRGQIWVEGRAEPMVLDLKGNAWPDPEPNPGREGIDWIRVDGEVQHPLHHRCFQSAMKYWHEADELGLEELGDKGLEDFVFEFQTTATKLAGALEPIARGQATPEAAFTVAYLKRALDHLHKSQAGLEAIAPKKILPEKMIAEARRELFEIREGILRLMDELRGRS